MRVTISKKWHKPQITTVIDKVGISVSMSMDDFKKALLTEVGSVTWVFNNDTFASILEGAIGRVLYGIKEETTKVV
jgi:hypothetical protein